MIKETNIWLITDTHFGHDKMLEYCNRPTDFNETLEKNLMELHDGVLIHLGDICIGRDSYWHEKIFQKLDVKKWLVKGNHDKKSNSWYLNHGWDCVVDGMNLEMYGKKICLSHRPKQDDFWYDINIHGHFHNTDHRTYEPALIAIANMKQKLLAVEYTGYKPVLLRTLIESRK